MGAVNLWLWDDTNEVWVKAPACVATKRMTDVGQVVAGAHKLCWVACNPSAGLSLWEIADSAVPGGAALLDCYSTARESKGFVFNPPCPFTDGIYLETFTNMTSITFGYV